MKYSIDHDVVIEPEDGLVNEGIALLFEGAEIERVSRTYLALWNDRGDTIRGSDIVDGDPLRLRLEPGNLALQARVLYRSRESIGVVAVADDHEVKFTFDFMDEGDGVVVEVLHSGKARPELVGTIRGASISAGSLDATLSPRDLRKRVHPASRRRTLSAFAWRLLGTGLMAGIAGALITDSFFIDEKPPALVDPANFNLQTAEGQMRFARAVDDSRGDQIHPSQDFLLPFFGSGTAAVLATVLITMVWRKGMPRSILNESVDDQPPLQPANS